MSSARKKNKIIKLGLGIGIARNNHPCYPAEEPLQMRSALPQEEPAQEQEQVSHIQAEKPARSFLIRIWDWLRRLGSRISLKG